MPGGMNGRQLAEAVVARRPGIKVLNASGYTDDAIVHEGHLNPGLALLRKPYRKADLAQKIREVLGSGQPPTRKRGGMATAALQLLYSLVPGLRAPGARPSNRA